MLSAKQALIFIITTIVVQQVVARTARLRAVPIHLLTDAAGNESLIVKGKVGGREMLFMIDTAYAGAPVLSTSYLALLLSQRRWPAVSIEKRYRDIVSGLRHEVTPNDRHNGLSRFLATRTCRTFTSGCTMRLMGIGATSESQSDMLLCERVTFAGPQSFNADVFVTHPLPSSVHILTMDFLMHRAPCVIMPGRAAMQWRVQNDPLLKSSFEFHTPHFVGGAICVTVHVGGSPLNVVIDTGAAAALSIAGSSISQIKHCERPSEAMKARQRGVNGEEVCSDVITTTVSIGSLHLGEIETFANSRDVEGADGYAGMGLLRMVDLWISPNEIGFRRSGLSARTSHALAPGECSKGATLSCTLHT